MASLREIRACSASTRRCRPCRRRPSRARRPPAGADRSPRRADRQSRAGAPRGRAPRRSCQARPRRRSRGGDGRRRRGCSWAVPSLARASIGRNMMQPTRKLHNSPSANRSADGESRTGALDLSCRGSSAASGCRLGCFSFRSAFASIWRMRSRVTENCWPTSSSVWSVFMPMPKRMRSTRSSRGVSEASTRVVVSRRLAWIAASIGQDRVLVLDEVAEVAESSSSPIGVSSEIGSLAIFITLRTFSSGMRELFGQLFRRRLAADLVQHLARGAHDLVDRLDHVHRNADGARLVGDRAGDRLPDPPGRIGRELVAAAVLELVDRLHQADVAFLDEIEELQAAVGVFLGDRDHEAQVGLDHFLLGDARLALALLHHVHDAAEFGDLAGRSRWRASWISSRMTLIESFSSLTNFFQPNLAEPCRRASASRGRAREPWYSLRNSSRGTL